MSNHGCPLVHSQSHTSNYLLWFEFFESSINFLTHSNVSIIGKLVTSQFVRAMASECYDHFQSSIVISPVFFRPRRAKNSLRILSFRRHPQEIVSPETSLPYVG